MPRYYAQSLDSIFHCSRELELRLESERQMAGWPLPTRDDWVRFVIEEGLAAIELKRLRKIAAEG